MTQLSYMCQSTTHLDFPDGWSSNSACYVSSHDSQAMGWRASWGIGARAGGVGHSGFRRRQAHTKLSHLQPASARDTQRKAVCIGWRRKLPGAPFETERAFRGASSGAVIQSPSHMGWHFSLYISLFTSDNVRVSICCIYIYIYVNMIIHIYIYIIICVYMYLFRSLPLSIHIYTFCLTIYVIS